MVGFHVGAAAAFFFVDAGAILAAAILYCVAGMLGIGMGYHRLLTHRGYKTLQVGRVLSSRGAARWRSKAARSSGWRRIAFTTSIRIAKAIRTRRAKARGGRTSAGSSAAKACITMRRCSRATCPISCAIAVHVWPVEVALDVERDRRPRAAGVRRRSVRAVGHLLPHDRSACTRPGS